MVRTLLFFMQGIPELMGIIAFSLALVRVPLRWGIITCAGTAMTVIIFIIRSLPMAYGLHTVVATLLVALFIIKTTRSSLSKSLIVAIASICTLATIELAINYIFFAVTKLDQQAVISNDYLLWKLLGLPQDTLMILFAVIISKLKKPDKNAWKVALPFSKGQADY
ncbi:MAG: hypothetical protein A4E55_01089 [Pelotomaculum sp. PtaU1.Bin035]|nr:MAG: hypothetical protein A4E55_01089 [Pelotomaculum sp. PtaU1.Bin035]